MKHLRLLFLLIPIFILPFDGQGHTYDIPDNSVCQGLPDSIVYRQLDDINVYAHKKKKYSSREYNRMVTRIKKVYPFAKEAAHELDLYNEMYQKITTERERRKYVKKVEKELFAKHETDIRRMTITEGKYLLLLIDRETGNSSYELLKEIKGSFSAAFWQGVAKVFKNDLKERYDPLYRDWEMENIVEQIEAGKL